MADSIRNVTDDRRDGFLYAAPMETRSPSSHLARPATGVPVRAVFIALALAAAAISGSIPALATGLGLIGLYVVGARLVRNVPSALLDGASSIPLHLLLGTLIATAAVFAAAFGRYLMEIHGIFDIAFAGLFALASTVLCGMLFPGAYLAFVVFVAVLVWAGRVHPSRMRNVWLIVPIAFGAGVIYGVLAPRGSFV